MFSVVVVYFLDDIKVRLGYSRYLFRFTIKDIGLTLIYVLTFLGNGLAFPMIDHIVKQVIGCGKPSIVIRIGVLSIYDDCDNTHTTFI